MKLALGTAQFGLAYGIAGRGTAVPEPEVRAILEDAAARGFTVLDTATAYGDIETRLPRLATGLPMTFVSKIPAVPDELAPAQAAEFALRCARLTHAHLGKALRGLMVHRSHDLEGERGDAVWPALTRWAKDVGTVIGASCYSPEEAAALAIQRGIALTQLPGNVFDQRIARVGAAGALAGVDVHLRSAFLQGLLLMPLARAVERLPAAREPLQRWHAWVEQRGLTPLEAALSVVKSFASVSTVVVGTDSLGQWCEIADAWRRTKPIEATELAIDRSGIIDPRLWSLQE